MIPHNVFVQRFRAATARGSLPTTLVAAWEQIVESCEEGYGDELAEYRFDLQARDVIEQVFHYGPLQECPQMGWVREQVAALDLRFRALLQQDVVEPGPQDEPWWRRHPLRYAGAKPAAEYARYGVHVEVREV
ncbi:hypothetical protein [Actinoplanes sp. NPDC051859]|uniref:hypothetical protein n=1 Tax=Actinoplanes sp. NPDC051859 TaxID=3363909 RepID=UPI003796488F